MLARADAPIDPSRQAVLFYLYADDLVGLREVYRQVPGLSRAADGRTISRVPG